MRNACVWTLRLCWMGLLWSGWSGGGNGLMAQTVVISDDATYVEGDASAVLDIWSESRGLLVPRVSEAAREAMEAPATGLLLFQTDGSSPGFYYNAGLPGEPQWVLLAAAGGNGAGETNPRIGHLHDIEGRVYPSVVIGPQEWMMENLRLLHRRDGQAVAYVREASVWAAAGPAAAVYDNLEAQRERFGLLYNGYAATDGPGLCPAGWRLPATSDWQALFDFLSAQHDGSLGDVLMGVGWWDPPPASVSNASGFSALPAGMRNASGVFEGLRGQAAWWSAGSQGKQMEAVVLDGGGNVVFMDMDAGAGLSVRCMRDIL